MGGGGLSSPWALSSLQALAPDLGGDEFLLFHPEKGRAVRCVLSGPARPSPCPGDGRGVDVRKKTFFPLGVSGEQRLAAQILLSGSHGAVVIAHSELTLLPQE